MNKQNLNHDEPAQSSKIIWITIIAVVLTAIIVGGGVYVWQKSNLLSTEQSLQKQITDLQNKIANLEKTTQSAIATPEEAPALIQPVGENANWKTYRDQQRGFEFQYPEEVVITDVSMETCDNLYYQGLSLATNELTMHFSIANTQEAYHCYHGSAPTKQISSVNKEIGQLNVEKLIVFGFQELPSGTWVLSYDFNNQNNEYKLSTWIKGVVESNPISKSTEDLMEQILATFKFTE